MPFIETISSARNPKVLAWRSLKDKKGRDHENAFLVEGIKMVGEALSSSFSVASVLLREGEPYPALPDPSVPVYQLPEHVFASVCDTKTPQGVAAVVQRPVRHEADAVFAGRSGFLLALDGIQDPGNMGTMIRTADAAGFRGVILSPDCVDIFSPKVVRATMGSIFRVAFSFPDSLSAALCSLRNNGCSVISSQLDGNPFYGRQPVPVPLVLVVGNEGNGISDEVKSTATHRFRLPMLGGAESLNAAVAAGIMMYDLLREHSSQTSI